MGLEKGSRRAMDWFDSLGTSRLQLESYCACLPPTHVMMEKKQKAMAARAASAPCDNGSSSGDVACHWLARKQNATNHRKLATPRGGKSTNGKGLALIFQDAVKLFNQSFKWGLSSQSRAFKPRLRVQSRVSSLAFE